MTKLVKLNVAMLFALGMSSTAFGQTGFRPRDVAAPPTTLTQPDRHRVTEARFQVIPYGVHAYDETGPDWPGSDEIYLVFRDAQTGSGVRTPIFPNFDTGETKPFAQAQSCVTPIGHTLFGADGLALAWECREGGVRGPLSFSVEIYEDDGDTPPGRASYYSQCTPPEGPSPQPSCEDDLIGRADISFSLERLLAALPQPGAQRIYNQTLGEYAFYYRVVRLDDVVIPGAFERLNERRNPREKS
jgi:hypothetical protein